MRIGSSNHPVARSMLAAVAAVALGASPALAGRSGEAEASASPSAEVSSTPTVETIAPPPAEDPQTTSPASSPEQSGATSSSGAGPSATPPPSVEGSRDRDRSAGRGLAQAAVSAIVAVRDNRFVPATITVEVGSTIVWDNEGAAPHTVTANDRAFDSGTLDPGGRFQVTFDRVGTVPYYCQIHGEPGSGMTGVVRVVAASDAPQGQETSADPDALPRTGSEVVPLALLVLGLALAGSVALRAGTRRGRG